MPGTKSKVLRPSLGSGSPQTKIKIRIRRVQLKDEKALCCVCCGINLYGVGSTYNLLSHDLLSHDLPINPPNDRCRNAVLSNLQILFQTGGVF